MLLAVFNSVRPRWFGSVHGRTWIDCMTRRYVEIDSEIISPVGVVSDLGVYLDDELSMKQHVNRIAATCFFHLHHLRQIRRHIGRDLTVRLIIAFIMTRFDYCNSVLAGLSQTTLAPLQHVQNAAVRLVLALRGCEDVTPFLIQLHWLPVRWRIYFKLCTIMHGIHTGRCPAYLLEIVYTLSAAQQCTLDYAPQYQLTTSFHDYA